jgi:hypothetical protein
MAAVMRLSFQFLLSSAAFGDCGEKVSPPSSSALRYHWYPDLSLNISERAGLYARLITAYHIETAGRRITRPH